MDSSINREDWLLRATDLMKKQWFHKAPRVLPRVAVSCGFPRGSSKAIGQCWDPIVSKNGTTHVFICPSLDDPITVLGTLLHELIHACVGIAEKHGGQFAKMAREVGLEGKLTATYVKPETKLWNQLQGISSTLGDYPHKAMVKTGKKKVMRKRSKRIKLMSQEDPSYVVFIDEIVLENSGLPLDPWKREMVLWIPEE